MLPYPIDSFPSVLPGFESRTGRVMNVFELASVCLLHERLSIMLSASQGSEKDKVILLHL